MASATITKSIHLSLGAGVEDVITLSQRFDEVEILNRHATGTIFARTDNVAATVNGQGTIAIPPGQGIRVTGLTHFNGTTIVRLISSEAANYSVMGV